MHKDNEAAFRAVFVKTWRISCRLGSRVDIPQPSIRQPRRLAFVWWSVAIVGELFNRTAHWLDITKPCINPSLSTTARFATRASVMPKIYAVTWPRSTALRKNLSVLFVRRSLLTEASLINIWNRNMAIHPCRLTFLDALISNKCPLSRIKFLWIFNIWNYFSKLACSDEWWIYFHLNQLFGNTVGNGL